MEANRPGPTAVRKPLPLAEVVDRRDLTPDLMILRLRPGIAYSFEPGQYCTIGVDGFEKPYSIVSAPHEPAIELFVELVPHGELTPRLWRLRPGDTVTLRPRAKGVFTLEPRARCHLLVATVTGIAPFVSMVRDALHRGARDVRFVILQGASYQDEFAYREELEAVRAGDPELVTYVPTVSRPAEPRNHGWHGATGRVNTIVEEWVRRLEIGPPDTDAYACGHPGMIDDVGRRLGALGFTVKEERYWPE